MLWNILLFNRALYLGALWPCIYLFKKLDSSENEIKHPFFFFYLHIGRLPPSRYYAYIMVYMITLLVLKGKLLQLALHHWSALPLICFSRNSLWAQDLPSVSSCSESNKEWYFSINICFSNRIRINPIWYTLEKTWCFIYNFRSVYVRMS